MFERFTDRARKVLTLAQEEAGLLNHSFIGTEHILLGLLHEGEGVGAKALESLDISLDAVREKVEETIGMAATAPSGSPPFTPRAKKVLELSLREALQLGHSYIGTEHLLLGLVREGDGVACQVLIGLGADLGAVRQKVLQLMEGYSGKEAAGVGGVQRLRKRPWSRRPEPGMTPLHEGAEVRTSPRPALAAPDRCALCDRDLWEVAHYVAVGRWQICDTCIRSAVDVLDRAAPEPRRLSLPPRVFGEAPDDEARAVVAAVDAAFGSGRSSEDRAGAVEDFSSLEPALGQIADLYPVPASIRVSRVRFTSTDAADVRFHLAILGTEPSFDGQLRRRDGRWVLTRRTVADVLRWAGVDVPPPSAAGPQSAAEPREPQ